MYEPVILKAATFAGQAGILVVRTIFVPVFGGALNDPVTADPGGPLRVITTGGPAATVPARAVYVDTEGAMAVGTACQVVVTFTVAVSIVSKLVHLLANAPARYLPVPTTLVKVLIVSPLGEVSTLPQALERLTVNLILTAVTPAEPVGVSFGVNVPLPAENLQLPRPTPNGIAEAVPPPMNTTNELSIERLPSTSRSLRIARPPVVSAALTFTRRNQVRSPTSLAAAVAAVNRHPDSGWRRYEAPPDEELAQRSGVRDARSRPVWLMANGVDPNGADSGYRSHLGVSRTSWKSPDEPTLAQGNATHNRNDE